MARLPDHSKPTAANIWQGEPDRRPVPLPVDAAFLASLIAGGVTLSHLLGFWLTG